MKITPRFQDCRKLLDTSVCSTNYVVSRSGCIAPYSCIIIQNARVKDEVHRLLVTACPLPAPLPSFLDRCHTFAGPSEGLLGIRPRFVHGSHSHDDVDNSRTSHPSYVWRFLYAMHCVRAMSCLLEAQLMSSWIALVRARWYLFVHSRQS